MTTIGMGNITPDNIRSFFKSMGKDVIDQFAQQYLLWHATCIAGDTIMLPFDFTLAEQVSWKCADNQSLLFYRCTCGEPDQG